MKSVILGWGSLIWDPRELEPVLVGPWQTAGPVLPIEFARISKDGRLTLVIDAEIGTAIPTRFAQSSRQVLQATAEDLRRRERTSAENIGSVDLKNGTIRGRDKTVAQAIRTWADAVGVGGVVWTDLPSNFAEHRDIAFTAEAAADYVMSLQGPPLEKAKEYIRKAPPEVDTPVRRLLKSRGVL